MTTTEDTKPAPPPPMSKLQAYRAGKWVCPAPPVCTALWKEADWIKFIDRDGNWTVPVE